MPTAFPSVASDPQSLSLISPVGSVQSSSLDTDSLHASAAASLSRPLDSQASAVVEHSALAAVTDQPAKTTASYHRIAEVRKQQGLSLRTISRRTGLDIKELRRQENPATNLTLSQIYQWQRALEVPLVDLLEDESDQLSRPVKERAQMVRIMKTVVSLGEVGKHNIRLVRLTAMLREQILQLMPELSEIGGWPQCGSRRGPDVMGRIFHEPITLESSCE